MLFVGGRSRSVYALDPNSGEIIWEYALPRPASGGLAVGGGGVFVGCNDHNIYALNSTDGHLMWKRDLGFAEWNSDHAWVVGQSLRTTIGALSVVGGTLDTSRRLRDDERVSEGERLLTEKLQEYPRQLGIDLKTTYLYLDEDLAFVVRAEHGNRTFLNLFDMGSGALLRRFSLGDRPISGVCRSGDVAAVGVNGRLMVFSIQKSLLREL
jgi:outer membrane protein assembly factor BamB